MTPHGHPLSPTDRSGKRRASATLADPYPELGIEPDGADLAAIHDARNEQFGALGGDTALMLADGRSHDEVREHLARWALLDDAELGPFGPDLALFTALDASPTRSATRTGGGRSGAFLDRTRRTWPGVAHRGAAP